jgi:hypothetical protein
MEEPNIYDGLHEVATQLKYLGNGNAGSTMGAVEFLATEIRAGLERLAVAVEDHASAITQLADVLDPETPARRKETMDAYFRDAADSICEPHALAWADFKQQMLKLHQSGSTPESIAGTLQGHEGVRGSTLERVRELVNDFVANPRWLEKEARCGHS